jgi:hypothetical protein
VLGLCDYLSLVQANNFGRIILGYCFQDYRIAGSLKKNIRETKLTVFDLVITFIYSGIAFMYLDTDRTSQKGRVLTCISLWLTIQQRP